jgi:hypothetical protein
VPSPEMRTPHLHGTPAIVQPGLRANWRQLTLLVIVNAFVGGMVGLERSIVPLLGQRVSGLASASAVGVYRLWRDSGYVIGGVTFFSGIIAQGVMRETLPHQPLKAER